MSTNPLEIIGEILGEPAADMRNPVNAGYECPFINSQCIKRSQKISGPYPICSLWRRGHKKGSTPLLMCTCPKRFYAIDLVEDVVTHCWPGTPPRNPVVAHDIKMKGFGEVDFVIADLNEESVKVRNFVSVELQAVDISGSVEPAYHALIANSDLTEKTRYGFNWANVRKRFISQLIAKGFYHHYWGTRIIAVLQTTTYEQIKQAVLFDECDASDPSCTIVFLLYDFVSDPNETGSYVFVVNKAIGTNPQCLMEGSRKTLFPSKNDFCEKIFARLNVDST